MNRFEKLSNPGKEAKIAYRDGDYQVVTAGDFVVCAVSGQQIPLHELKYWSVEHQEPYASAQISLERYRASRKG